MIESKGTISEKILYELAQVARTFTAYEEWEEITDLLVKRNVFKKVYPKLSQIEKMQLLCVDVDTFWHDLGEGDYYYEIGTIEEMIARLEGKT